MASSPRLFIASTTEALDCAQAVQFHLEEVAEPTVWHQAATPSRSVLDGLLEQIATSDFAVFVATLEDTAEIRGSRFRSPRDNIVLELGIALAQLGRDRVFLLVPRSSAPLRLPTDLDGVVHLRWTASRADDNVIAAMGPACLQIRRAIRRIGPVTEHRAAARNVQPYFLVADDDLTPESTLVQHLKEGIGDAAQVRVVRSASEACGLLRLGGVVACLTDIVFRTDSEMAGLRVVEAARAAGVPVRVMTGHRRGHIGLALAELERIGIHAESVLRKPVTRAQYRLFLDAACWWMR